ncbi:PRD domain-containing protein [Lacticaseibacillus absianus]|uniref:PRD domain-containing protein n=1 Tax=Lacticaseibacillus absianus TaxID=2729623 RepID=UPI0015CAE1D6|nr:PRD domain-containing protein [Lacticaseibacillus absianus]
MQLVIRQIYNNNSALVTVSAGKEAVVQGKGIGFGKRRGDTIESKDATKILYLGDDRIQAQFTSLLKDVPLDIVVAVFDAIDHAKQVHHLKLLNYLYVTLGDHVFQMYKKLMAGQYRPSVVPSIEAQYPVEYAAARDAWRSINQNLHVYFPPEEVKSLALHFINAQGDDTDPAPTAPLVAAVNQVVQAVFAKHQIHRTLANRNYFDRLMIHLQYLVERMQDGAQDEQTISTAITQDFHQKYPRSFAIAGEVAAELASQLHITLTANERLYFIIHIQRLIQENED